MNRTDLLQIAKPILFNTPMVQAILDGRKTATRRIIKYQLRGYFEFESPKVKEPYKIGNILYVRETFFEYKGRYYYRADGKHTELDKFIGGTFFKWHPSIHMPKEAARVFLRVANVRAERLQDIITGDYKTPLNINAEGLYEPCCGCTHINGDCKDFIRSNNCRLLNEFIELWNSTIKKDNLDRCGWNANPWVWVIEFERLEVS